MSIVSILILKKIMGSKEVYQASSKPSIGNSHVHSSQTKESHSVN